MVLRPGLTGMPLVASWCTATMSSPDLVLMEMALPLIAGAIGGDVNRSYTDAQGVIPPSAAHMQRNRWRFFASMLQVNDISKLLSLLKTQGDVQVLSSPREYG